METQTLSDLPREYQILALVIFLLIEWALPRMRGVRANSTVEAIANAVLLPLLGRVPLVGAVARALATRPEAEARPRSASETPPQGAGEGGGGA